MLFLKGVEVAFRRSLVAVLTRVAARTASTTPAWDAHPQRVLFLRHDRIGDMVVSTGVLHMIKRAHPSAELHVLASPLNASVVEKDPAITSVVRFNRHSPPDYVRLFRHFRRARYDVVVDPMVFNQSLTTLLLTLATRAPHRVGVVKPGKPNVYTMIAPPHDAQGDESREHILEYLAQLAIPFGVEPARTMQMSLTITDDERVEALRQWGDGTRLLINISAGEQIRRWSDDRYVAIARHLRARIPDARVLIMHGPGDGERAARIARDAEVQRADTRSLRAAMALVAEAQFVFTPDTSIVHIAGALNIPIAAIFTTAEIDRWRPRSSVHSVALGPGPTMDSVSLADAQRAVDEVIDGARLATGSA